MRKIIVITSVSALLLLLAVIPYIGGSLFKDYYLALIANNSYPEVKMQVTDYKQGWLHSSAKLHVTLQNKKINQEFDVEQTITHGPLLYDPSTNQLAFLYGYVQSAIPLPKSDKNYALINQAEPGWIQFDIKADFSGLWSGLFSLPDIALDQGNVQWQNLQGAFDAQAKNNILGPIHTSGSIQTLTLNDKDKVSMTFNVINFDTVTTLQNAMFNNVLTTLNIGQIVLHFSDNTEMNVNNAEMKSLVSFANNKAMNVDESIKIPSIVISKINGHEQNIQFNNTQFQTNFDLDKLPFLNANYNLALENITTTQNTTLLNANGLIIKGEFTGNVTNQWNLSNLINLHELIIASGENNITLRGLKDKLILNADILKNIKLQNILNNDLISITGTSPNFNLALKDFKILNTLTHASDDSESSYVTISFPNSDLIYEGDKNFNLVNFGLALSSTTDKNAITNKKGQFSLSKLILLKESLGPFTSESQLNHITFPDTVGLIFIKSNNLLADANKSIIYPQTLYTGSLKIDSPYGNLTSDSTVNWDVKQAFPFNADTEKTNFINSKNSLLYKLNLVFHYRMAIDMFNHYLNLVDTLIDNDHQRNLAAQAKMGLQLLIQQGYIKIDKTDYVANITANNGTFKVNGKDVYTLPSPENATLSPQMTPPLKTTSVNPASSSVTPLTPIPPQTALPKPVH